MLVPLSRGAQGPSSSRAAGGSGGMQYSAQMQVSQAGPVRTELRAVRVEISDDNSAGLRIVLVPEPGSFAANGVYHFPFALSLPTDMARGTFTVPGGGSGRAFEGECSMSIRAKLSRPTLRTDVVSASWPVIFAPLHVTPITPMSNSSSQLLGGGNVSCVLSIDRSAVVPGQTVRVHAAITNATQHVISSVCLMLVQTCTGMTRRGQSVESVHVICTAPQTGTSPFSSCVAQAELHVPSQVWASLATVLLRNAHSVQCVMTIPGAPELRTGVAICVIAPQPSPGSALAPAGTPLAGLPAPAAPYMILAPPVGVSALNLSGVESPEFKLRYRGWQSVRTNRRTPRCVRCCGCDASLVLILHA